jgi:hypothetical protein
VLCEYYRVAWRVFLTDVPNLATIEDEMEQEASNLKEHGGAETQKLIPLATESNQEEGK